MSWPEWTSPDGRIRLINADCLDVLPTLAAGSVDAVVTDPPYGTGWVRGGGAVGVFNAKHERPEWDVWDTSWMKQLRCSSWAVFCPLARARDVRGVSCYYHKTNPRPGGPTREAVVVHPEPWRAESSAASGSMSERRCWMPPSGNRNRNNSQLRESSRVTTNPGGVRWTTNLAWSSATTTHPKKWRLR